MSHCIKRSSGRSYTVWIKTIWLRSSSRILAQLGERLSLHARVKPQALSQARAQFKAVWGINETYLLDSPVPR